MGYIERAGVAVAVAASLWWAPGAVSAHPVSFKGATMLMGGFEPGRYDVQTNYTFSKHLAIGASYLRIDHGINAATFALPQLNWLLKRWNNPSSQANIYLYAGVGYRNDRGHNSIGGLVGGEADYESRRFYTSVQHQSLLSENEGRFHRSVAKVGVAPYLADFHQPSLWFIGKGEYASYDTQDHGFSFSPGLRLLYRNLFLEAGSSFRGRWYTNVMVVF